MPVSITLCLPREVESLRMARTVVSAALSALEVTRACREQFAIVVSEACGNVVAHADGTDAYVVRVNVTDGRCDVEVVDQGAGFVYDAQAPRPQPTAASGRGLYLIDLLTDQVIVTSDLEHGTTVWFTKRLEFTDTPTG
ncbi:ATP-binding protein [Phytohabitans sp. LJ34]|uniref:ATP-binding protein n=1 Tax=Phytohabitans sp. LJ34 TaxID=3452217 RepID=UPI003F8B7A06